MYLHRNVTIANSTMYCYMGGRLIFSIHRDDTIILITTWTGSDTNCAAMTMDRKRNLIAC